MKTRKDFYRKKNPVMIIDCNAICHYAKHSLSHLEYDGSGTGIIYGFLNKLLSLQKELNTKNWVFCWDDLLNVREVWFPDYKKKRHDAKKQKSPEEKLIDKKCIEQFNELKFKILKRIGFKNIFYQEGMEGDDLIARAVQVAPSSIIVARDNDLYQLLGNHCSMYDFQNMKSYSHRDFRREYGIASHRWAEVKALAGCPGDEVPGLPGIGYGTAIKYLKGKLNPESKAYKKIVDPENKELIALTKELTKIPIEFCREREIEPTKLKFSDFEEVCLMYGMDSFLEERRAGLWKKIFRMAG